MNHATKQRTPGAFRFALAGLGLLAGLALFQSTEVHAAVSGGATIFNEATVNYSTPSFPGKTAKGSNSVTVLTKAAAAFVTVTPTTQTTGETTAITYTYNIINQSNGIANLAVTTNPPTVANSTVSAPGVNALGSYTYNAMWGGISLTIPANNTVTFPAGALTGVTAGTTQVAVKNGANVYYYTVATINNGTVPSTGVAEVAASMTLTPVGSTPALTAALAGSGGVGVTVGEYRSTTHSLTTGTVSSGTSGTHTTNITVSTTDATPTTVNYTTNSGEGNQTVTTVLKTPVTVVKAAVPTTAKPGDTVTYTITVTNNTTEATTAATIADPLSPYITYTADTTTLNGTGVGQPDGGTFPLSGAGISINSPGQGAGIIAPSASAVIIYQVTVK